MCGQRQGWMHSLTEMTLPFLASHLLPGTHACAHSALTGTRLQRPLTGPRSEWREAGESCFLKLRDVESSVRLQRSARSVPGGHFQFLGVLGSHRRGAMF